MGDMMKLKPILKTLWISLLSTMTLILAQTLTTRGFEGFNTIRLSFLDVPLEYFIINFLMFLMLTILFIVINELLPMHKLSKGLFYALMVSIVWIALKFQPNGFENFKTNMFASFVFIMPLLIYGLFLGYLATEKTFTFEFKERQKYYFIVPLVWILFHLIYVFVSGVAKGQVVNYIIWIIVTSLILGLVFGLIYELSLKSKKNSFYLTSLAIVIIFGSFYAYQYAINREIDIQILIKLALDIVSIILATQVLEIFFNKLNEDKTNG